MQVDHYPILVALYTDCLKNSTSAHPLIEEDGYRLVTEMKLPRYLQNSPELFDDFFNTISESILDWMPGAIPKSKLDTNAESFAQSLTERYTEFLKKRVAPKMKKLVFENLNTQGLGKDVLLQFSLEFRTSHVKNARMCFECLEPNLPTGHAYRKTLLEVETALLVS